MTGKHRLRRLAPFCVAMLALALVACAQEYPNTTFTPHSEYGRSIDQIWDRLLLLGTIVFVLVELILIFIVIKYRKRDDSIPPQTHGHTQLEILWTLIPAIILVFIAVPTVRTIFVTQGKPGPGALQVQVVGHQWWWEFRYPEFTTTRPDGKVDTLTTANELYIPVGRTVNLQLNTEDVIHSFWVPQLAGKRDLVKNRTNYIWFTPDSSMQSSVWNGFCTEYCGASHANMKFRVYTVQPEEFASWAKHQITGAAFNTPALPAGGTPPAASNATPAGAAVGPGAQATGSKTKVLEAGLAMSQDTMKTASAASSGYSFPAASMPAYAIPNTPIPASLKRPSNLVGDASRGAELFKKAAGSWTTCYACHTIAGAMPTYARTGPNLTHVGSRNTIGGGLYKNDADHLFAWIKNAQVMKPGALMKTIGKDQWDPTEKKVRKDGLTDQQIADVVAYLQALK
jgi:cytochrome c oxidase subunit II